MEEIIIFLLTCIYYLGGLIQLIEWSTWFIINLLIFVYDFYG